MAQNFQLVTAFKGYVNKPDVTNIAPGFLVTGSKNVLTNDGERVSIRQGYTLFGSAAAGTAYPVISSYEWKNNRGVELAVRRYNDTLEYLHNSTWYTLKTGLAITDVNLVHSNFTEFWDNTNKIDLLLFTDGTANIFDWGGGLATFASATVNTITKQGSTTWAQEGFLTTGTRKVVIGGTEYTYTGGETTTTLTGVTPDPTGGSYAVGVPMVQAVRTNAVSGFTDTNTVIPSDYKVDLIEVLNNQVYIGNLKSREIFLSKVNSYTDYSKTAVRVTGEGEIITLDAVAKAFSPQDEVMNVSAGDDYWYVIKFDPAADLTSEVVQVKRLKSQSQKGAKSQSLVGSIINQIVYVSEEPTFDSLGNVENFSTQQIRPISDSIKIDFDSYDFTNGHVKYFKNNIYLTVPVEGLVLIYNLAKGWWEAPQVLPARRMAIINGELYIHSSINQETYKLFDGYNDNSNPINAVAAFSYINGGVRTAYKNFTEHYTEGYIQSNSFITLTLNYDYKGFESQVQRDIDGNNTNIIFNGIEDFSLGTHGLGTVSLGGGGGEDTLLPPKYRAIQTFPRIDFFEYQPVYSSNEIDFNWSILAFGPAMQESTAEPVSIKD